eukprot:jgi/Mesvir1/19199/Mv25275-RA.1
MDGVTRQRNRTSVVRVHWNWPRSQIAQLTCDGDQGDHLLRDTPQGHVLGLAAGQSHGLLLAAEPLHSSTAVHDHVPRDRSSVHRVVSPVRVGVGQHPPAPHPDRVGPGPWYAPGTATPGMPGQEGPPSGSACAGPAR